MPVSDTYLIEIKMCVTFVTANDVDPLVLAPVLIIDCTCEVQNGDEKLNTVKFTWRYKDNRPIVRLSASRGIITSPYNIVYS